MRRSLSLVALGAVSTLLAIACAPQAVNPNGGTGSPTPSGSQTPTGTPTPPETGSVSTPNGGSLDYLIFAIVGDTRPATSNDTSGYPTAVITRIWQDVQGNTPYPAFAIATGDYQFSGTTGTYASDQMDKYLTARAAYQKPVFYTMGNHECDGATASNCLSTSTYAPYKAFMSKMQSPNGYSKPYYSMNVNAKDGSWTAKFVFIAANSWDSTQASWLTSVLSQSTTYTFVMRHEGIYSTTAPGVTPSQQIITQHPYTLLLEGHTHEFNYYANDKEVITGNGGAPLTGSSPYGFTVIQRLPSGKIRGDAFDYQSHNTIRAFEVDASGNPTSGS